MTEMSNRRKSIRRGVQIFMQPRSVVDAEGRAIALKIPQVLIVDLSSTGMRIETGNTIPEQALITGEFKLPNEDQPISCELIVLRQNKPFSKNDKVNSLAIEYTRISDSDRRRIEQFVTSTSFIV